MKPRRFGHWSRALLVALLGGATGEAAGGVGRDDAPAEVRAGERLFFETRFAQFFAVRCGTSVNAPLATGDPALKALASATKADAAIVPGAFPGQAMSCRACHLGNELKEGSGLTAHGVSSFADFAERSPVPERSDAHRTTPRNAPSLVDALAAPGGPGLLHYDGEFSTAEELVQGTFVGRNFGWLPEEHAEARRHFARVIREDDGTGALAANPARLSYAVLLRGADAAIPAADRLPESFRLDPARASDDEILTGCARLVGAYLRSLQFSRDADGLHSGSPFDAFLALNRLPRAAMRNQTPHEYGRRLGEAVAALRAPRYIDLPERRLRLHDQAFRFGELELRGMRIFFKAAISAGQTGGAGNCAECHVPPHFTDFSFHNTGVAQEEFDARHGVGAFAQLVLPGIEERAADYDRWLPPTPQHPHARGISLSPVATDTRERTDLGLWNVYGNPDLPAPQPALEHLLNPNVRIARGDVLAGTVARFKTSGLRDLGQSAPYLHTGRLRTIEEVVSFYQRTSSLAHDGKLRNAPPEFFAMRLNEEDIAPLAAFLRALNEDYERALP